MAMLVITRWYSHGRPRFSRASNDVVVLCPSCPKPGTCVPCHRWLSKILSKVTRMSVGSTADFVWAYPPLIYIYTYIHIIYTYINQMYIFCRVMQQVGKCICSATCKLNKQKDAQISGRSRTRLFLWLHDWLHQSLHPNEHQREIWEMTLLCGVVETQQFDFWELNHTKREIWGFEPRPKYLKDMAQRSPRYLSWCFSHFAILGIFLVWMLYPLVN